MATPRRASYPTPTAAATRPRSMSIRLLQDRAHRSHGGPWTTVEQVELASARWVA